MSKSRRNEISAIVILALWVVAWLVSLKLKVDVPMALNAVMPMASAVLLGIELPIDIKKKEK